MSRESSRLSCFNRPTVLPSSTKRAGAVALVCLLCLPLLLLSGLFAGSALAGDQKPVWSAGKFEIFAIQDRPGEMSIDLFKGPATPEERQQYFKDGKTPSSVNAFLIRYGDKNILVDTGFGTGAPGNSMLVPALAELGLKPENIDLVVLTHMHMDHIGGLLVHKEKAFPKASVLASEPELKYWRELYEKSPDNANAALVNTVMEAYKNDFLPPFSFGDIIIPYVTPVDASGHTPGHTALLFETEGQGLIIIGDLLHAASLQFPLPKECARYDIDPEAATAARIRLLDMAAEKKYPVAGMHIPFPGIGTVTKSGEGYTFSVASEKN